jgi:hypothetical protein
VSVPLRRLFFPEAKPTEGFGEGTADLEGYVVRPAGGVTVAVSAEGTRGAELLESVWTELQRSGLGRERQVRQDDRGRTVYLMTLDLDASEKTARFLRSVLVVPVHAEGGFAEVHLFVTPAEVRLFEDWIAKNSHGPTSPADTTLPRAHETKDLRPEDWAFLGLLSAAGALDRSESLSPESVARLLGMEPMAFAEQAWALQHGLESLVTGLFVHPGPSTASGAAT